MVKDLQALEGQAHTSSLAGHPRASITKLHCTFCARSHCPFHRTCSFPWKGFSGLVVASAAPATWRLRLHFSHCSLPANTLLCPPLQVCSHLPLSHFRDRHGRKGLSGLILGKLRSGGWHCRLRLSWHLSPWCVQWLTARISGLSIHLPGAGTTRLASPPHATRINAPVTPGRGPPMGRHCLG